jgi:hypothetical protein
MGRTCSTYEIYEKGLQILNPQGRSPLGYIREMYTYTQMRINVDFKLSRWLNDDVDSVPGCLYRVDAGNVIEVSEVHGASIYRVKVCRLGNYLCANIFM